MMNRFRNIVCLLVADALLLLCFCADIMFLDNATLFIIDNYIQLEAEVFNPHDIFPLIPIVNNLCNIECCVYNILQIFQNKMVSHGLELELSMFRKTAISSQHLLT